MVARAWRTNEGASKNVIGAWAEVGIVYRSFGHEPRVDEQPADHENGLGTLIHPVVLQVLPRILGRVDNEAKEALHVVHPRPQTLTSKIKPNISIGMQKMREFLFLFRFYFILFFNVFVLVVPSPHLTSTSSTSKRRVLLPGMPGIDCLP